MATHRVKIGIMSFAHIHALGYAAALQGLDSVEFVGIADDNAKRAKEMAERYDVKAFKSYDELLESDIDGVIVCSENVYHRKHVVWAAQHEKHILCEKPLATTKQDSEAMVEVCKRSNVKLQTAFPCRYHSAYRNLKGAVKRGEIGQVLAIKATNQGVCPGGWFTDTELSGGGAAIDHTVHALDLMRDLLGAEPTRVYAEISNRMYGENFDDTGILTVDFSNNVFTTIDCSWSRPKSGPFWGNVKLEVTGTLGVARMDMFGQIIEYIPENDGRYSYVYWGDDLDSSLIASFARSIAEDTPVEITGEDGARAVEVAVAAYQSSKTGRAVDLPL